MPQYTNGPDYSRIQPKGGAGLLVVAMAFIAFGRMFSLQQTVIIVAIVAAGVLLLFPVMRWVHRRTRLRAQPLSVVPRNHSEPPSAD